MKIGRPVSIIMTEYKFDKSVFPSFRIWYEAMNW